MQDTPAAVALTGDSGDAPARILNAALMVFALKGFDGATIRDITEAAEVNIASINYHFGSKEELIRQVLLAYLQAVTKARYAALDRCERESAGGVPSVEALVEALVRPVVEVGFSGELGRAKLRLMLHARSLPRPTTNAVVAEQFDPMHGRFLDAFQKALPGLSREELVWRYTLARGAMMHLMIDLDPAMRRIVELGANANALDAEQVVARMVAFIAAGMKAEKAPERAAP